ncbi:MAG: T9SS type A sorting domain-containing protein [Bacteroidetes bacterium]|nr:MAG: T9SS type A sorting domain-containing protein [Bacteroidota bacterium]
MELTKPIHMKTALTTLAMIAVTGLSAQITINSSDYSIPVYPDTAHLKVVAAGASTLAPGTNATWDLSGVFSGANIELSYDAVTSSNFPTSMAQSENPVDLGGGLILTDFFSYYSKDANGFYEDGFEIVGKGYSLAAMTGDGADSLYTLDTAQHYAFPHLQFPLSMGSNWSGSFHIWIPMEITIESVGWYDEQISLRQDVFSHDTVVGWGNMILPTGRSAQVLMVHSSRVRVDSVMMNGAPMDPILAQQFGFTQNDTIRFETYSFYTHRLNSPMYEYSVVDGNMGQPYFNRSEDISTGEWSDASVFIAFPNPAKEELRLMTDSPADVDVINMSGARVAHLTKSQWNNGQLLIRVAELPAGLYIVRMGEQSLKITVE